LGPRPGFAARSAFGAERAARPSERSDPSIESELAEPPYRNALGDGISADSRAIMRFSLFQLLNAPGFPNAANTPLAPSAVTLSRTDLISF
jgi:hypothetical protein